MNERIKEITGQVLDELVPETWTALGYDKIKEIQFRTAELVVRECIRKIEDIAESSNNPQPIYRVAVELLEHFGVQE